MNDDPLSNLPPATQERAQEALRAFAGGSFQHANPVFVSQSGENSTRPAAGSAHPAWAHWEYSPAEWELFDQIDWRAVRRAYWLVNLLAIVASLLIIGVVLLLFSFSVRTLLIPAIPLVFVLVFLFALRYYGYNEARKRHRARQNQPQQLKVTLSEKGAWEAGTYFPLNEILLHLRKVTLTTQPCILHFQREQVRSNGATNANIDTLRVLVPQGHEEEAQLLLQRYQAEVIHASQKPLQPREPA